MLISLSILLSVLSSALGTYVVYFPNLLIPGIQLKVRVHVQNSDGPVSVNAGLKFAENGSVVAENMTSIQNGVYSTISIDVPSTLLPSRYKVHVSGSIGLMFENSSSIHYDTKSLMVFIQTDKIRYSAGQTVKYRIVFLLPNLLVYEGQATITIQDGQDNKIEVRKVDMVTKGVISGTIPLSRFPIFGNWKLKVDAMGMKKSKSFEVNDYVLPRFTVELTVPPAIKRTQNSFQVGVKASFTFKANVNGNCTIILYNEEKTWNNYQLSSEINGSAEFTIDMSNLTSKLNMYFDIMVRAIVMDHATELKMVAERRLNIDYSFNHLKEIRITKVDVYKNSYVRGMTYRTKIFVGINGKSLGKSGTLTVTPTVTTAKLLDCPFGDPPYKWVYVGTTTKNSFTIEFDESGYADLTYMDNTINVEKISFKIEVNNLAYDEIAVSETFEIYPLSTSLPVLRMSVNRFKGKVGENIVLDIIATENLRGDLTFEIYARGIYLTSERTTLNNVRSKTHTMTLRKEMIPRSFIVVNHLTRTGQLIADYVHIEVEGDPFTNEVQLSYNTTQIQPGQTINMHISADPSSTVFVLAEDQRNRVFGIDNDIFWTDVVSRITKTTSPSVKQNVEKFGSRNKRVGQKKRLVKRSHGQQGDLDDIYIESGLIVLSDAKVSETKLDLLSAKGYKQRCTSLPDRYWDMTYDFDDERETAAISAAMEDGSPIALPEGLSLEEIVRSRFPDTWLWEKYDIGPSGELDIAHKVPDSMTTWVTSAFVVNTDTGFGICKSKPEVTVRKTFFLTLDLPSSIVYGEEFLLQISVFNDFPISQLVFLRITLSEDPNNPIPASTEVKENDGHSTYIRITPKQIGVLNITVTAYIVDTFMFKIADKIMKSVTVLPNGVFKTTNEQHLIDVAPGSGLVTKNIIIHEPKNMVENTRITKVIITGNFMAPTIEGLENLIRIPYGCGEQTLLNFAPAIYITNYLTIVGKLTPTIKAKSIQSLKTGLQRELKYQRQDGSFSAFGKRDSSGSSWLTAFVLKCFGQAEGLITIDNTVMVRAMDWLLRNQYSDGSFREPGRVIHYHMQGGSSSGITMTAFILISILENRNLQVRDMPRAINLASKYLEENHDRVGDSYTQAILCYALASADSRKSGECFKMLKKTSISDDDKVYWRARNKVTKREVGDGSLARREPSIDVEASSYALLTYVKLGKYSEAFPIVKWLVSQRNPSGGQRSTQDTVISIQALAEFASSGYAEPSPEYGVSFTMSNFKSFKHVYTTDSSTFDVVHGFESHRHSKGHMATFQAFDGGGRPQVPLRTSNHARAGTWVEPPTFRKPAGWLPHMKVPNNVESFILQAAGSGSAVIDVSTSYYISGDEKDDCIKLNVKVKTDSINTATIRPCLRWTGRVDSGMLLMEVEMPTGFQLDNSVLKNQTQVMKHETNGRNIALYFNGVSRKTKICVDVKMDRVDPVVKSQACHVKAYDYYDPVHQAMKRYELGILKSSNICNICPFCGFCTSNQFGSLIGVGR